MPRTSLPMGFSFYQSDSLAFSAQRCVNWIPVVAEASALNDRMLMQPWGLKSFLDISLGGNRGGMEMKEVSFFVNGTSLVQVTELGTFINRGTIPGTGRVSLANNGQFLVIVIPGVSAFAYDNKANTLTQITDSNFRISDSVVYTDGFFTLSNSNGESVFVFCITDQFTYDCT